MCGTFSLVLARRFFFSVRSEIGEWKRRATQAAEAKTAADARATQVERREASLTVTLASAKAQHADVKQAHAGGSHD